MNVPELKLLRQYHGDTISWISRFNQILVNIHEREDQETFVDELKCLQRDGLLLRVQGWHIFHAMFIFFCQLIVLNV